LAIGSSTIGYPNTLFVISYFGAKLKDKLPSFTSRTGIENSFSSIPVIGRHLQKNILRGINHLQNLRQDFFSSAPTFLTPE
jgi:hypothetical protein